MSDFIELPLSQDYTAIIDAADERLAAFKWTATVRKRTVYAYRQWLPWERRPILLHQAVIGRAPIGFVIDHEDGDGLNCRRGNLRHVPQSTNIINSELSWAHGNNTHRGVTQTPYAWVAQIGGKYLGSYRTEDDALAARLAAEKEKYGVQPRRARAFTS